MLGLTEHEPLRRQVETAGFVDVHTEELEVRSGLSHGPRSALTAIAP